MMATGIYSEWPFSYRSGATYSFSKPTLKFFEVAISGKA